MLKLLTYLFPLVGLAHEGHHHAPNSVTPPKGGVMRSLETVHLELLPKNDAVMIYIYDKKLKPVEAKKYPVSATATRPRKDAEKVKLTTQKDHWQFKYDAKGAHRYSFNLTIEQGGHTDIVKWNIEPKLKKHSDDHGHSH